MGESPAGDEPAGGVEGGDVRVGHVMEAKLRGHPSEELRPKCLVYRDSVEVQASGGQGDGEHCAY